MIAAAQDMPNLEGTDLSAPSFLVLGAGELGMEVLRSLAERIDSPREFTLTVLLRPEKTSENNAQKQEKIRELRALGVQFVFGDIANDSEASLSSLFGQYHTVIGCTGFVAGNKTQLKLALAVLKGGVKRYIPWQFGVDYDLIGRGSAQDLFDEQLDVRDLLRSQQSTEWVIISTGMFTSFLFEPSFGVVNIADSTVHALGALDTAVTLTTPRDIGILTREILLAEPKISNEVVYTAGDTITYAELADILERVLNRKMRRIVLSVPELKAQLNEDPDNALRKYRFVFAEGRGVAWEKGKTFNFERNISVVGAESWARDNLPSS